ncbi:MAG: hypothetical protein EOM91_11485 [Sphingobacteriia bacterium]|nr:hypothetical protein [Sphingobacteriia bacterium]NCC40329.1 hypothetical protein [Gammaproteobacteria bacterium]
MSETTSKTLSRQREPIFTLFLLTLLTLAIGAFLALDPHWGVEEVWLLYVSTLQPWTKALEEGLVGIHPPLYQLLLMPLSGLGTESFWWRLPSVIATALTVPVWYLLLRRLDVGPAPAMLGVLLLLTSAFLLELGILVGPHSVAILCLLIGLLGVISLTSDAHGARRPVIAALGLTLAFGLLYSSLFVTIALLLSWPLMWLLTFGRGRRAAAPNQGRLATRLALLILALGHLAVILWWLLGYGRGDGLMGALQTSTSTLAEGQTALDFAWAGLVAQASWLTPQFPATPLWQAIAVGAFWAVAVIVLLVALAQQRAARLLLVVSAFVATLLVLGAGLLGVRPFGAPMLDQTMLWPLYLLVPVLAIDALWSDLRSLRARRLLSLLVVLFALFGFYRANPLGEVDAATAAGTDGPMLSAATLDCAASRPLYSDAASFHALYGALHPEGIDFSQTLGLRDAAFTEIQYTGDWFGQLAERHDWDLFVLRGGCAPGRLLIRDRKLAELTALPDPERLGNLRALMDRLGVDSLQLIGTAPDATATPDEAALIAAYRAAGLALSQASLFEGVQTRVVSLDAPAATQ